MGECCKLPQRGPGSPAGKRFLAFWGARWSLMELVGGLALGPYPPLIRLYLHADSAVVHYCPPVMIAMLITSCSSARLNLTTYNKSWDNDTIYTPLHPCWRVEMDSDKRMKCAHLYRCMSCHIIMYAKVRIAKQHYIRLRVCLFFSNYSDTFRSCVACVAMPLIIVLKLVYI